MKPKIGFQALAASHEQPFIVIDKNYRILALNQAYERAFAIEMDQVIGRHCYEVYHSRSRPCHEEGEDCPHHEVYKTNSPHSCLHTHRDIGGCTYWVRVSAFPVTADDGETYLCETIKELALKDEPAKSGDSIRMVGESPAFLAMIEQLQQVAHTRVPVLLMGETGTGKELAAKFLHQHSDRKDKPCVTIDCTSLSETLVESELFGHERGAFTGSVGRKHGLIELADGGTLFLDEIGELSAGMQSKLLRVLDTGEFRRVGGKKALHADVRIICATNRHLWDAVKVQLFREDLYYRIACMTIHLPSLRERRSDIPLLANTLLQRLSGSTRRRYQLTDAAIETLKAGSFPGNIRELRNHLYAASAVSVDGWIDVPQLASACEQTPMSGEHAKSAEQPAKTGKNPAGPASAINLDDISARQIAAILREQHGSRKRAAAVLGISTRTLYRKMKRYGLK